MSSSRNEHRTTAPSPIPQPDDERFDPSLRARTPPPPHLMSGGGHSAAKEEAPPAAQDVPAHEYEVPLTITRTASNTGRPPAPTTITTTGTTAATTGNRPYLHTYDTINSLNTTQTSQTCDQSLGSHNGPQQVTVTFGTPSHSLRKTRAATGGGTPNTAVTAASSAASSAATSNSHEGSEVQGTPGRSVDAAGATAGAESTCKSRRSKPPPLPETPSAPPSDHGAYADGGPKSNSSSSRKAALSVPNLPKRKGGGAQPTTAGNDTESPNRGGARWVDAETHARNLAMASAAAAAASTGGGNAAPSSAADGTTSQSSITAADQGGSAGQATTTAATTSNGGESINNTTADGKSTTTALTTTAAAPSPMCWGSNLLRFASSASGGLLSPRIQPAFVDGGDCPSDEEGRREYGNGGNGSKYAGVYDDDEDDEETMEGAWSTASRGVDGTVATATASSAAVAANITDLNIMDGPASDIGENDNHKASSHPSDTTTAAAAATKNSPNNDIGGGEDDEYVELNASFEQKQGQKRQARSGQTQSFVQTIYENALDACNGCSGGVGVDGTAGVGVSGIGALPAGASGELSETAQELYAAATTSFDTLATGLQSMMNLGSTSDAGGGGGGGSKEDGGGETGTEAAAVASTASDYPVQQQQQRPLPMQAHQAQHQQDYIAPPSYYSERDRLFEEAAHYEASGDHAAALACLERCLPQQQATSGRHDLSLPALGTASGGQGSGEEYLRYTASTSTNEAEVLHKMGIILWKAGSYEASLGRLLDGLAIYRRTLKITPLATRADTDGMAVGGSSSNANIKLVNPDADLMADILNSIGRVYFSRGDYAQAMRYYNESLAIQTDVYADAFAAMSRPASPAEDLVSLSSRQCGNPGTNSIHASKSVQSLANHNVPDGVMQDPSSPPPPPLSPQSPPTSPTTSVASRKRRKAAIMHPGVARTTICMGMVHEAQGRYSRAMRFYKDGLRAQRSALGSDHVDVAATLNAMGSLYEKTGDIQLSMKCFEEALSIYRSRLGDDHTDTAVTLNNVGQVQFQLTEYDNAMESYSEALRIMKKNLGEEHRNVAATMHNIGLVYTARGQYSDALKIYRTVLNSQRAALGDTHFDVAVTLDSVASAYEGQERYEKAGKFYGKALRVRRAALGRDHVFVGLTLDRIGTFHLNVDRNYNEAVRRFDEAKAVYEANSLGKNDPRVKDVFSKLEMALKLDAEARAAVDF